MNTDLEKLQYEVLRRSHELQGELDYHLAVFGSHVAKREKYKAHSGLEAIYFYLVQKFSWTPSQVRGMSLEDIRFLMAEEMKAFRLPAAALEALKTSGPPSRKVKQKQ